MYIRGNYPFLSEEQMLLPLSTLPHTHTQTNTRAHKRIHIYINMRKEKYVRS